MELELIKNSKYQEILDKFLNEKPMIRKILEVLIEWARFKYERGTYGELATRIGFDKCEQFLGGYLATADDILYYIDINSDLNVPILNGLVKNKQRNIPSDGFEYVSSHYNDLDDDEKRIFVDGLNKRAFEYKKWDKVAQIVGVKVLDYPSEEEENLIRIGKQSCNDECLDCYSRWKKYIYEHPVVVGIMGTENGHKYLDYTLLSGDNIDVYIEMENRVHIAIKVMFEGALDYDVLRGLYECAKYKNMLDVEDTTHCHHSRNRGLLVIEGKLSEANRYIARLLDVDVYEEFEILE